jgi:hypothetical protein
VRPLAHGDSRTPEPVIGRDGNWVLMCSSFRRADRTPAPMVCFVRGVGLASIG